jgi:hypothetical protein
MYLDPLGSFGFRARVFVQPGFATGHRGAGVPQTGTEKLTD